MSTDEGRGGADEATVDLSSGAEIRIARVIAAPVALVFSVWSEAAHLTRWWGGPDGFTTTTHEVDVRPGGTWLFTMHGPDGVDYPNRIIFEEIVPDERIAYAHDGGEGDPNPGFHSTITFRAVAGGTEVAMRTVLASEAVRDQLIREHGVVEGGKQHLGRLAAYVRTL